VYTIWNASTSTYTQAVELWGTQPEDGHVYFVVRPPWVSPDRLQAFYTLFPEEQEWKTGHAAQTQQRSREEEEEEDNGEIPASKLPTPLSYASRLQWGTNFYAGTPASARLGTGHVF